MVYSSFVWRPSQLQKYQDCHRRQDTGLLNRRNHHCWSRPRQLTGSIVLCIHSRQAESVLQWLFTGQIEIFRAFYFCGRQTIENSIVHMGTNLYQCTHIMTSSISILVHFFVVYIFAEAGLSTKFEKICTQWKFPTIRYSFCAQHGNLCNTELKTLKPIKPYSALLVTSHRALRRKDSLCALAHWFCISRKGGTGGGGWGHW